MSSKIAQMYVEVTADTTQAQTGLSGLKDAMKTGAIIAAGFTAAYFAVQKGLDATVGTFTRYADSVRTISQLTNTSAESTSRLIAVTGKYEIGTEDLTTASRKLATQGLSLTVDTIAQLSDQFLKLSTGAERQTFLTNNLGRASAQWTEILSQGSAAIMANNAAVNSGLILNAAALDKAHAYELANKDLANSFLALKMQIGQAATPTLAYAANIISLRMEAHSLGVEITNGVMGAYKDYDHLLVDVDRAQINAAISANSVANGLAHLDKGDRDVIATAPVLAGVLGYVSTAAGTLADALQADFDRLMHLKDLAGSIGNDPLTRSVSSYASSSVSSGAVGFTGVIDKTTGKRQYRDYDGTFSYKASGGSFSGWAKVGDAPGGVTTPYTEYVYAPHGAMVYNQSQMSGKSAPPMNGGGMIGGNMELSDRSLHKLADLFTMALAKR
jgi:hypothetical protein